MMMIVRRGLLYSALAAGIACSDGPTEPKFPIGTMSFSYSGAESGTFSATGPLDPDGGAPTSDGATAATFASDNLTLITGIHLRGTTHADIVQIALPIVTAPRSFTVDDACLLNPAALACPFAILGINVPVDAPAGGLNAPPEGLYVFSTGTITVTSVTSTRIVGTFQGSAESLNVVAGAQPRVVVVTNGTFDVPVTQVRGG